MVRNQLPACTILKITFLRKAEGLSRVLLHEEFAQKIIYYLAVTEYLLCVGRTTIAYKFREITSFVIELKQK
ncbi:hypothetical protein E2986_13120 [Frieseomelitta varia]|uniref:Uncharacterized protein n=1 Tax=Frieseomelitta varia TaxID=561572 RepID=A0A833RW04_9HYME|nr:hypothetical protein E2986_13120 [Frieseomelitta varia]